MNSIKLLFFLASIIFAFSSSAEERYQHEINFGLINVDTFELFSTDFSEFPVFGGTYRYYFEGLSGNLPSHIESHLEQKSWVQYDINLLFGLAPSLSGQYYFDNGLNLEYDITYLPNFLSLNEARNFSVLSDFVLNKALNNQWQLGAGFVGIYNNESSHSFGYDRNDVDQFYMPTFQARYTDIQGSTGWDINSRIVFFRDYLSWSNKVTYLASSTTSYKVTASLSRFRDDENYDFDDLEFGELYFQISGSREHWFSKQSSIDIGIGLLNLLSEDHDGIPWLPVFELNGKHRF
ncbi:hypothetical protein KO525_16560 [Psychrosphaera sp. B3R10]|uniref:hypothetical protein n=1 Tax=unclassified Psychrosphaera TaxID=2641570 RepID=UPI001C091FF8|nr:MULTISPECIES: hypothetical protein [unclassified Psychrosphaera]MBU2883648.1 hypothetical protein [Psychrosphaera sp. I2R16]MBU2990998.1 hypothetical protein [Psychrosphaera sp. B3R10]